jgi:predicted dehydrogenase
MKDPVRVAIIGTGAWSGATAQAMKKCEHVELVTCFDPIAERSLAFSRKYGCDQERSYEDVLRRDDVHALHLTSPNAFHAQQTVAAAESGKHVFVEKPIANTMADGRKMVEACKRAGVVLMVGQHMRRLAGYRKMKELMDSGILGNLIQVDANFSQNLGFQLTPDSFRWRGDDSGCPGGALMTLGIHHADTFHYLFGAVHSVFSFFNKLYIQAPVEDVTGTILKFQSGVLGYLGSNYASPKAHWMYIYGTEANLLLTVMLPQLPFEQYLLRWQSIDQDTRLEIFERDKSGSQTVPLLQGNPIVEEIKEFGECILEGKSPETGGEGGLAALAVIRAAIESARTKKMTAVETP